MRLKRFPEIQGKAHKSFFSSPSEFHLSQCFISVKMKSANRTFSDGQTKYKSKMKRIKTTNVNFKADNNE